MAGCCFFGSTSKGCPWKRFGKQLRTFYWLKIAVDSNLGNHHHFCRMNLNHANLLGNLGRVVTDRPTIFLGFLATWCHQDMFKKTTPQLSKRLEIKQLAAQQLHQNPPSITILEDFVKFHLEGGFWFVTFRRCVFIVIYISYLYNVCIYM